jgi:CxxC motif-containing protein (DUF1111 family)
VVDRADMPLEALSPEELARFNEGDALFEVTFRESDGLGPLFIRDACAACHQGDGRGPGSVTRMGVNGSDPALEKQLLPFGSTVRPYVAAGAKVPLGSSSDPRVRVTSLLPPPVWGRGYLEAVSSAEIERLARDASQHSGPIRGRVHRLRGGEIGRFGLKARLASLKEFTAEALYGDMGITSPSRPSEASGPEGLEDDRKPGVDLGDAQGNLLASYVRLLAMPPRSELSRRGRELFDRVECAACHVPSLATSKDFEVKALAGIEAPVYTDLLLHDMGERLSNGVRDGDAGPREWRTAPLMGLRFSPAFLHDGRAKSVREAILAHGEPDSEARGAVDSFRALPPDDQAELVRFVEAL